jgi:phage terminase large subunit
MVFSGSGSDKSSAAFAVVVTSMSASDRAAVVIAAAPDVKKVRSTFDGLVMVLLHGCKKNERIVQSQLDSWIRKSGS